MRIILLVDRYLPSPLSGAKIMADLATELSRLGHGVTVVTGSDTLKQKIEVSRDGNVTVIRVRSGKMRHPSKVIRTINEMRLSGIVWSAAGHIFKSNPCDLIVYWCPTLFWAGLVERLKALTGCRSYLVIRDVFPQWALDMGILSRFGMAYWFFRLQELRLHRTADVIGVQSAGHLKYFANPPLKARYHAEILHNWTSVPNHSTASVNTGLRGRLGLKDKVIFVYGGNLGVAQDIDNILRLAVNMAIEEKAFFLLLGEGSESSRIKLEIERLGLTNVAMLPAVPPDEFMDILAECDVGLITLRRDLTVPNFPGKMLSYMALRMPMLASVNPGNDLTQIVHEYNAGLVCHNGDDGVFFEHALHLTRDPDSRLRLGNNAYALLLEKFDVTKAAVQILSHFAEKAS